MKREWLFRPVLTPVLRDRRLSGLLAFAALLQIGLAAAGLHGWHCPLKTALGLPCPGCGLTTAMAALTCGNWRMAVTTHPFAPGVLALSLFLLIFSTLPGLMQTRVIHAVDTVEKRTGVFNCIVIGMIVHWSLRIIGSL